MMLGAVQFFKQYDKVLRNYSSLSSGVGMDLILVSSKLCHTCSISGLMRMQAITLLPCKIKTRDFSHHQLAGRLSPHDSEGSQGHLC